MSQRNRTNRDSEGDPLRTVYDVTDAVLRATRSAVDDIVPDSARAGRDLVDPVRQSLHRLIDDSLDLLTSLAPRDGRRSRAPRNPELLQLRARAGSLASGRLVVTNDGGSPLQQVRIQASDLVATTRDDRIPADAVSLAPAVLDFLDADEDCDVDVIVRVPDDAPIGEAFLGMLTVPGLARSQILLRIDVDP